MDDYESAANNARRAMEPYGWKEADEATTPSTAQGWAVWIAVLICIAACLAAVLVPVPVK